MNRQVLNAVYTSVPLYPKLEWVVDDGIYHTRLWYDGTHPRFRDEVCFPPDLFKRSTTIKCTYYDKSEEVSIRIDVSDDVSKDMTEAQVKRYVIEDMVRRLSYAVFCPEARNN